MTTTTVSSGGELTAVSVTPSPGPAGRTGRTYGQGGATIILINLWQAFEWFGVERWTADQAAVRWPAVTAVGIMLASTLQNLWNWVSERRRHAIEVGPGESATVVS